ncbi:MAG: glycosyl hydrolase [Acidobacteria bacterium]|nr:glycosyl hydrolase [Acidobacteriota bacterium]
MEGLTFRNIGPFRGGRVTAVTGVRRQPATFYFGATGGGVWKTTDAGATWVNVSDKDFKTGSVGAIGVAESDPNVVYAGMGEAPIRGNASHGDGVYRSTDAGQTWRNVGLKTTRHIARVRVHPQDPDTAWVAAQGHMYGPNPDRGVFKTTDGGKSWRKVLFVDDKTGASDLVLDPTNPRILFAGFWQVVRRPWELVSGGPGSSLWKSVDGGETWKKLAEGLPEGLLGKVGVAVAPSRPGRIWALIEHRTKGGLYRSDDGGEKWEHASDNHGLRERAWYYTCVYADPRSEDSVWCPNVYMHRTVDGGKSWAPVGGFGHGDHHDMWIDPDDPARMIVGNDGGATVTVNGGKSWSTQMNQPTAQFYRVAVDYRWPYRIYGAQQDNTSVAIPSATPWLGIDATDWHAVGGGESGWIAPDPMNPDVTYAGEYGGQLTRYDHRTGQTRHIMAWPQLGSGRPTSALKYRFNWNAPLIISRHDPKVLYHAAQKLLRSRDEGETWEEASPDLTRDDPTTQGTSGGPITMDVSGAEVYGCIFALAESAHEKGLLWAGTDDGLVHLTRDGGRTWSNVTEALRRAGLPDRTQINAIDASPFDAGTAWVAATHYRWNDFRPLIFLTRDYGKTWQQRTGGLPAEAWVRVVREDPGRRDLLYAGTETGLFVSFDGGRAWRAFQRNLPVVPLTDLVVKGDDLVVATQGRSFWILDDLTPLRQWGDEVAARPLHVFDPGPAIRMQQWLQDDSETPNPALGANRPVGAAVDIWLKEVPKTPLTVEVWEGPTLLRKLTSAKAEPEGDLQSRKEAEARDHERMKDKPLELKPGLNRIRWDLRILPPWVAPKAVFNEGDKTPPRVAPGRYTVRVKLGAEMVERRVEVKANPGVKVSPADLQAQYALLRELRDRLDENHRAVTRLRDLRGQVKAWGERRAALQASATALATKLEALERKLTNPDIQSDEDDLVYPPMLDHDWVYLAYLVGSADAKPTAGALQRVAELKEAQAAVLKAIAELESGELAGFQQSLESAGLPRVMAVVPAE